MARLLEAHAALRPLAGSAPDGVFRPGDVAVLTVSAAAEGGDVSWPTTEELATVLGQAAVVLDEGADAPPVDLVAAAGNASARAWPVQLLLAPGARQLPAIPLRVVGEDGSEAATGEAPAIDVTISSSSDR